MKHSKYLALSIAIALLFTLAVWQMAEPKLANFWGGVCYTFSGHSFMELNTKAKDGIPMRYYPSAGKVFDPQFVARESTRFYETRIEPERLEAFLNLSQWLLSKIDDTGNIAQDYPYAKQTPPWYSASTQSAAMLALANRAGHLRELDTFHKARTMLAQLETLGNKETEGGIWFWEFAPGEYSLKGHLNTLIDLGKYHKLTKDSLAGFLFTQGTIALAHKLPHLKTKGYLDDRYHYKNQRSEHMELTNLLSWVNKATPDSIFKPEVIALRQANNKFVLFQMLQRPRFGRIIGFLIPWGLVSCCVFFLLKPKPHNETEDEL